MKERTFEFQRAFRSRQAFIAYLRTDLVSDTHSQAYDPRWSNRDLLPSPPEHCNWSCQFISSVATWYNSRAATTYHIGYPAVARSVFEMWGSVYVVSARAALAIIWYGIQLYQGSSYIVNILHAIFGHYYTDTPNGIPASMGFTTQQMIAFLIFWLLHIPFIFLRPYQVRHFFTAKAFLAIPAAFGLFIYCMVTTRGNLGPLFGTRKSNSNLAWTFIWCINSGMGNVATLITNQPDLARWAKSNRSPMAGVLIAYPLITLWNPWDLMAEILNHHWRSDVRFAIVLCASAWVVVALATNIGCNMIPFGADASLLWPKYLTITRRQLIVHLAGFAICPWKIMASASIFLTFLSGYAIFMGPVVAVMICEYFIISRGNIFIPSLYHYWYHRGWNVEAYVAYVVAVAIVFPGFIGSLGAKVSIQALDLGRLGWCLSFIVAFFIYWFLNLIWPHRNIQNFKGLRREELAKKEIVGVPVSDNLDKGKII
ncbi:allantoin [Xylogone sp. PMI_703]|nr:allantoin [Xylogone sp. PMI_703]